MFVKLKNYHVKKEKIACFDYNENGHVAHIDGVTIQNVTKEEFEAFKAQLIEKPIRISKTRSVSSGKTKSNKRS